MKAGLIVNPLAGKGTGKGLALVEKLARSGHVFTHVIERFEGLPSVLAEMAGANVTDLFISSGDGTIQEILTEIAERSPFGQMPRICLLPHGTTNLSANDLGFRSRSIAAQAAFVENPGAAETALRNTIRCLNPGDGKLRHGMFVGTGAVAIATRYCQEAFNSRGVRGEVAVARTLLTAVRKYLFSAPDPADEARFDRPSPITVEANGQCFASGMQLLQMSTTLNKLVLNANPFWGERTGPIRTTVIPYPVPSVARWILPVMYGGPNRASPPGTVSFCSESVAVSSTVMFTIDGEFFPAPVGEPLRLETGPSLTFLRGPA
ncbi:diacylglycerol/lipid kinase family protein [Aestuariivirga sp.]|uniref:diacylglycerol/lipid kinase family protein n=1 Tax=Aestuariivirga sp. TaxID=2650926 RepID=UPI003BAB31E8